MVRGNTMTGKNRLESYTHRCSLGLTCRLLERTITSLVGLAPFQTLPVERFAYNQRYKLFATHSSLFAVLHRLNLASSFTLKPKIFGSYLSAFNAAGAVLTVAIVPSCLCIILLTSAVPAEPAPTGWPFVAISCGCTIKSK